MEFFNFRLFFLKEKELFEKKPTLQWLNFRKIYYISYIFTNWTPIEISKCPLPGPEDGKTAYAQVMVSAQGRLKDGLSGEGRKALLKRWKLSGALQGRCTFVDWKKVGQETQVSPEMAAGQMLRSVRQRGVLRDAIASLFGLLLNQYPFCTFPTMGRVYFPPSQILGLAMWLALAGRLADVMWEEVLNMLAQFGVSPVLQWSAMKRADTTLWAWAPEHTQMEQIYIQTSAWSPHISQGYPNPWRLGWINQSEPTNL